MARNLSHRRCRCQNSKRSRSNTTDRWAVITLCRPEVLNALNSTLQHELYTTFQELDADAETNAIVVTGSGDRAFSAGADIKEMARLQQEGGSSPSARHTEDAWDLANARKPTIGALNGLAYGGGAVLASSFDIRVGCSTHEIPVPGRLVRANPIRRGCCRRSSAGPMRSTC